MLRPDLFESVDLKNAVSQIMCMSRKSDLEYYETDPGEKAQVPDTKVIDSLLMKRQHLFRPLPPPSPPALHTEAEQQQQQQVAAAARRYLGSRRPQSVSAGRSRYLLVNASNALVSSFSHISMREGQLAKGKYVTLTFHVRQPNWFDQMKQVYVNAKIELDKLIAFMLRMNQSGGGGGGSVGDGIEFQDFVKAERDLVYSEQNLRQWAYKFDVELRRDTLMRHAIEAFQCRLGLDGCDNLGYSFGLFLDECLCTNETAPRLVVSDSTPANYKIADRADIFVTNYFAMTANRAFREEVVSVLYEVYVRDSTQHHQQQHQQQKQEQQQKQQYQQLQQQQLQLQQQLLWNHQQQQQQQQQQPTKANTLTHYEKPPLQLQQQQARTTTASCGGAIIGQFGRQHRPMTLGGGGSVVRIQVPNSRQAAAADAEAVEDSSVASSAASSVAARAAAARSQLLYVGNS